MEIKQSNKRLRLDRPAVGSSKEYKNTSSVMVSTMYSKKQKVEENTDLWGEEMNFDDDVIQQLESQALSQFPETDLQKPENNFNFLQSFNNSPKVTNSNMKKLHNINNNYNKSIEQELLTKRGEVTNLRIEMDNKIKEFKGQLDQKDNIIESLKKQLCGKQSEIEFQKIEKMSQICRTPKTTSRHQQSMNSSFHERFPFSSPKNVTKDAKIFNFGGQLHKGDILYKLLDPVLSSSIKTLITEPIAIKENNIEDFYADINSTENEFAVHLGTCLLQLCRFASFEKTTAEDLIKLIITRSYELLLRFYERLFEKEIKKEKSKIITLQRTKDTSEPVDKQCFLLMNTKLFTKEKGIAVRQTVTMLAILLQIEPKIVQFLVEPYPSHETKCTCDCVEKIEKRFRRRSGVRPSTSTSYVDSRAQRMDVDQFSVPNISRRIYDLNSTTSKKSESIFDAVDMLHKIVQEVTIRGKTSKYEGVFSSILHFFSVLCSCSSNIIQDSHKTLMVNTLKNILFSLPGFIVVQYIIKFLNNTIEYNFSESLCCRSAAETFAENFKCFYFTKETCMLQVLCAYIEMMKKSSYFIDEFTSWIVKMTTVPHHVKWMENNTDSKICECLPIIEQITIKIMLNCIENYNDTKTTACDKLMLKSFLKRSTSIFKQFRWQDVDFDIHIANCRGEYKMLLNCLREIIDSDVTTKFVTKELEILGEDKKYELSFQTKTDVLDSMMSFSLFSEDDHL